MEEEPPIKDLHPCYVDNGIYKIVELLDKLSVKLHLTPNIITTISIPFCVLSIYLFYIDSYWSIPFFLIYIILDYLDGYFARKHDMVTTFGDYYDHIRDGIFLISLSLLIIYKIYSNVDHRVSNSLFGIIVLIILCLSILRFSYNEKKYKNNESLNLLKSTCKNDSFMGSSKFICIGTSVIFVAILMFILIRQRKS